MPAIWEKELSDVAGDLDTDLKNGLSGAEAETRLLRNGKNRLEEKKPRHPILFFLDQFKNFIIWVLIGAAVVSGFLGEWIDGIAILAIVILNAVMGFIQEFRAEKSLAALKKLASPFAKVIRDGSLRSIPAEDIVAGDLMEVEAGDNIPCDGRVVFGTSNFSAMEASLTGESLGVHKHPDVIRKQNIPLGDRRNCVFMGTSVTNGKGRFIAHATAMKTELGKIAGMLQEVRHEETPLQKKLNAFGKLLIIICGALVALVFAMGLWQSWAKHGYIHPDTLVEMFLTSVSLAVAAIPEGLPAVVTIALALGIARMVKRHALIRKLPSVETLGSASVICSDKTGTLTRNEMTVKAVFAPSGEYVFSGSGYSPVGDSRLNGKPALAADVPELERIMSIAVLCNGAELLQKDNAWKITGDPTEGALITAAHKTGITKTELTSSYEFVQEAPFDAARKMMSIIRKKDGKYFCYTKGAPDIVLKHCTKLFVGNAEKTMDAESRRLFHAKNEAYANDSLRVLAMAYREFEELPKSLEPGSLEQDLVFTGLTAMMDPPREEVKTAIHACKAAGIRPVMITGDHKGTAVAIARSLDFFTEGSLAYSGEELDRMDDAELDARIESIPVYARVSPEHKLRIVRAWRKKGHVVAMTGDGVNDAPAVKEADIGVAMGITGTDVTKEVSDMIVTDDNFASIVSAVEEGRGIFDNIQKFIHYLLSCNVGEILVMFLSVLVGMPVPLLPVHILWINLVTDGLPALALGVDPIDRHIMKRKPRAINAPLIPGRRIALMTLQGFIIALCSLGAFSYVYYLREGELARDFFRMLSSFDFHGLMSMFSQADALNADFLGKARTMAFIVLAMSQVFHAFNCRSQRESLFRIGILSNKKLIGATLVSLVLNLCAIYLPFFNTVLKTQPLTWLEFAGVVLTASLIFWFMELVKFGRKLFGRMQVRGNTIA